VKFSEKGFAIFLPVADPEERMIIEAAEVCAVSGLTEGVMISMNSGAHFHVLGAFEYVIEELDKA